MSLSIPRRYPHPPGPPGERRAECAYCSMTYYRSTMFRDSAGHLTCTDGCEKGLNRVDCDRANAADSGLPGRVLPGADW